MDSVQHLNYLDQETRDGMEELMDYDAEIIIDLLDTFLESSKELMYNLEMGVHQQQLKQVREAAHSLKSASAQVGALDFSVICQKMEDVGKFERLEEALPIFKEVHMEFPNVLQAINSWKEQLAKNIE